MDKTVHLDTISPVCLQYACSDNKIYVAREPIASLIDIPPVFIANLEVIYFYPVGKFLSMGTPIHKLSSSCTTAHEFHANL